MLHQPTTGGRIALSFTGGKDCVLALHLVAGFQCASEEASTSITANVTSGTVHGACAVAEVCAQNLLLGPSARPDTLLVTFVPKAGDDGKPVRFKAHPLEVVKAQAIALGMEHLILEVEGPSYLEAYQRHIRWLHEEHGVATLVTGDILDVCDGFMTKAAQGTGVELVTPLWHAERDQLLHMLNKLNIQALVSCVNMRKFHELQQAQRLQQQRLQQEQGLQAQQEDQPPANACAASEGGDWDGTAPAAATALLGSWVEPEACGALAATGVDPCGEHGEFHTLVTDAPLFKQRVVLKWEAVQEDDFAYLSILSCELQDKDKGHQPVVCVP